MRILVIGSGGREHALCWRVRADRPDADLYCAPGSSAIAGIATTVALAADDVPGLVEWSVANRPDLVVVGPEDPCAMGLVDRLSEAGIRAFGPSAAATRLESSKAWTTELLDQAGVPIPDSAIFESPGDAHDYVDDSGNPLVVKADGLALGKGVLVCDTPEEAHAAIDAIMVERQFGDAGSSVVIQERCYGPELSVFAICAGTSFQIIGSARDYKRAYDDDRGLNTGGVGAYSPVADADDELLQDVADSIIGPTLQAASDAGGPFTGVLYAGLMLTEDGPVVIEFNIRFGDPEAQVILPTMRGDLVTAMLAALEGDVRTVDLAPDGAAAVCVVLASGGYPGSYETGHEIIGLETLPAGALAFHAGTEIRDDRLFTAGGRVLGIVGTGPDVPAARENAYAAVDQVTFQDSQWRTDIAATEQAPVGQSRMAVTS
jgi:phosphoribosylamine--glycine ligase